MKNIIYILAFFLLSITKINAQTVSMSLACPTTTITAGNNFNVNANYAYSSVTGNITVTVNYNPLLVAFNGSPSFSTPAVVNPTTGVISYTFPSSGTGIQAGAIQMTFRTICPQTCFGPSLSANFTGNISSSAPVLSNAALPCTTNYSVVNNISSYNNNTTLVSFDCITNRIRFTTYLYGGNCFKVENPNIKVTSSIAGSTLVGSTINGAPTPFNSATNIISLPTLNASQNLTVSYTLQLPCSPVVTPTTITVNAQLNGDNCGTAVSNLHTIAPVTYTTPVTNSNSDCSTIVTAAKATISITNNGSTPINGSLTTNFPAVKITSFSLSGGVLSTEAMTLYTCTSSVPIGPTYNGTGVAGISLTPVSVLTSKAIYDVTNLQPGETATAVFNYDSTAACSGSPISTGISFVTTGTYTGISGSGDACYNCTPSNGVYNCSATYNQIILVPEPNMNCYRVSTNHSGICRRNEEVLPTCIYIRNNGNADLLSGVVKIDLPNYLDVIAGTVMVNGLSTGFTSSTTISPGYLTITLSNPVPSGGNLDICYDLKVNSLALNGLHSFGYSISGSNHSIRTISNCPIFVRICQDPKVEILKEVKGSEDTVYSASGNAMAGTTAKFRITVSNTGNTPISNMEIIDRYPQNTSDVRILNCIARPSDFAMFPTTISPVFTPSTLGTGATNSFETSGSGQNKIPLTWAGSGIDPTCDANGTFGVYSAASNTMKINVPGPLLPFTSYTIEIEATVPYAAIGGQLACNTAALRCSYLDETAAPHVMEIIETDPACLIVAPPPCDNCKGLLNSSSLALNPGTTTSSVLPYVIKTGTVTITIAKPVQEIRLSIADLQYSWDKEGCTNCKSPAISRGCLFPMSSPQNIGSGGASGYLVWDNYTGSTISTATAFTDCPEELVWKLGVMLQPGTYTIPFQLTLPKPVIEDCCKLKIDKFDIKVSLKDADCKVCETIITPRTDDCCTGSKWIKKQITWSLLTPKEPNTSFSNNKTSDNKKLEEITDFNKLVLSGEIAANPIPWYGVQKIECGKDQVYRFMEGSTRTFSGSYACNPALKNCVSQVFISIKTISGNYINVVNQPSSVVQTFAFAGEYEVTYTAFCGTVKCNECTFKVIVEKNCCPAIKVKPSTITTTTKFLHFLTTTTTPISNPPINSYSSYPNAIVTLNYTCPQGCSPTYIYTRSRRNAAGVYVSVTGGGGSGISPLTIPAPTDGGVDRIAITVKCGNQVCANAVEIFDLSSWMKIGIGTGVLLGEIKPK